MADFYRDRDGKLLTDHSGALLGTGMRVIFYREGRGLEEATLTKYNPETDQIGLELVNPPKRGMSKFSTPYWKGKFHVPAFAGPVDDVSYEDRESGFTVRHNPLHGWSYSRSKDWGAYHSKFYDTLDELIEAIT